MRARRGGAGSGVLEPVGTYTTEITARIVISCQLRCVSLRAASSRYALRDRRDRRRGRHERAGPSIRAPESTLQAVCHRARGDRSSCCTRGLAGVVELASTRMGCGDGNRVGSRRRPGAECVQSPRRDAGPRLASEPARGSGRTLGCCLVPGDRPLRLPSRPGRVHVLAHGVLPALPTLPERDLAPRRAADTRRCAAVERCARARAVRHPPPDHARVGARWGNCGRSRSISHDRPRRRRRGGSAGSDGHGLRADGVLLLGGLFRVAVPGAVGRGFPMRPAGTLDMGRGARRPGRRHAQRRRAAAPAGGNALPVWAAGGQGAGLPHRRAPAA